MKATDRSIALSSLVVSIITAALAIPAALVTAWLFWVAPHTPADEAARMAAFTEYVNAIETWNANSVAGAAPWASPGSPAEQYALARSRVIQAFEVTPKPVVLSRKITEEDGALISCALSDETDCVKFASLITDELDRVRSFKINDVPVATLVLQPDGTRDNEDKGLRTEFLAGFRSSDLLNPFTYVAVAITDIAGGSILIEHNSFRYIDTANTKVEASVGGPSNLAQAQNGLLYALIAGAPGGYLGFDIVKKNGERAIIWVSIK